MNEFGAGVPRTVDFVKAVTNDVLLSNCDPDCQHLPNTNTKTIKIVEKDSIKIGVVGFMNPDVTVSKITSCNSSL